ncbi:MAG: cytochrome P450 [Actinobacteria bacterium]|nr:cytochrome P450 [Actinomycetota bacterium]
MYDPFAPEVRGDPYPLYAELRQTAPVYWSQEQQAFLLTRYADCVSVLRSAHTSVDDRNAARQGERRVSLRDNAAMAGLAELRPMLFSDPPDHTRMRSLVAKAFTPKRVEGLRPHIAEIVDGLLADAGANGGLDVVADLAFPLPVIVICELLGVPVEDRDQLKGWSRDLARTVDPIVPPDVAQQAAMAGMFFINYLNNLIDERRAAPRDDLLSALIAAEDEGERLTHEELLINTILLFVAGHETTQNLIGNGLLALLRHPDELAAFRDDRSLAKNAVEEMLRYDGPVQLTARIFTEDGEVGGVRIPKGETAILLLGAAHRDPEQFPDPDRFDIRRENANHNIAFGHGIHHCLGAPLARVEAQIALTELVRRFPRMTAGEPVPSETFTLRGLSSLPIHL